ncbi:TolC family outer membrane protein [Hydrogenimonas sp.]
MKKSGVFLFALIAGAAVSAQALTLKSSIEHVLDTNPALSERINNFNRTYQDLQIARSGYYPNVDLYGDLGFMRDKSYTTGFDVDNYGFYNASLTLTQNIFNGYSTTHRVSSQEARLMAAAYSFVEKADELAYMSVQSYIEVVKNRELERIAKKNIRINKEIYEKVKKLYNAGLTTLSEVNKIESSLSLAKSNYVVQQNNLSNALFNFQRYYGKAVKVGDFEKPTFSYKLPSKKQSALEYAMGHNPSIMVTLYDIEASRKDWKEKESPFYPKLDFELRGGVGNNFSGTLEGNHNRLSALVRLNWNLFRGGADEARRKKGLESVRQQRHIKEDLKRQVSQSFNLAWASYIHLQNQLKHLKKYKKFSEKTLQLYIKEYDMGRRTLLDLLGAQNDLISAQKQIVTSKYDLLFAKYRILDAMGEMVLTVMDNAERWYSKVGIGKRKGKKADILPTGKK